MCRLENKGLFGGGRREQVREMAGWRLGEEVPSRCSELLEAGAEEGEERSQGKRGW
jgi:hypothetical protein